MIQRTEVFIQKFQAVCVKCKRQLGVDSVFDLFRRDYYLVLGRFKIKIYSGVYIQCTRCKYEKFIPEYVARKIFKKGISVTYLTEFLKSALLTNPFFVFIASLWSILLLVFTLNVFLVIYKFYNTAVLIGEPYQATPSELRGNKLIGKIIRIKGKADLTQAFSLDQLVYKERGIELANKEIYFPVFLEDGNTFLVVFRGNHTHDQMVREILRSAGNQFELMSKEIELVGKVEQIKEILHNEGLKNFFLQDYPTEKMLTEPMILIDALRLQDLNTFVQQNYRTVLFFLLLFLFSFVCDLYLEKNIRKRKLQRI